MPASPTKADQPTLPGSDSVKMPDERGQLGVASNHVRTQRTDHEAQYRAEFTSRAPNRMREGDPSTIQLVGHPVTGASTLFLWA